MRDTNNICNFVTVIYAYTRLDIIIYATKLFYRVKTEAETKTKMIYRGPEIPCFLRSKKWTNRKTAVNTGRISV